MCNETTIPNKNYCLLLYVCPHDSSTLLSPSSPCSCTCVEGIVENLVSEVKHLGCKVEELKTQQEELFELTAQMEQLMAEVKRNSSGEPRQQSDESKCGVGVPYAVAEAQRLLQLPDAQAALERCLRDPPPLRWKCFLSHVQKEAADSCRLLSRCLKEKDVVAWYDKEAGRLDLLGMIINP
eukprot:g29183.t1